jgi:hypothetical protein
MALALLTLSRDAKTVKGEKFGYLTGIQYLAPGDISGTELCANRTPGCSDGCLFTAGRGQMNVIRQGRIKRTMRYLTSPKVYRADLASDIAAVIRKASRDNLIPVIRLNGTSDLDFTSIMPRFPDTQFYDYTKSPARMARYLTGKLPPNYHLTFSRSESNESDCLGVLARGGNVAVVFSTKRGEPLPATWHGYRVVDGDVSDLRFRDPKGVVVGLRAKGKARKDTTGFVVNVASLDVRAWFSWPNAGTLAA